MQEIAVSLIESTPEHWSSFYVLATVISEESESEDLEISIYSNQGYDDIVVPTDELNSRIFRLFDNFKTSYRIKKFKCIAYEKDEGGWAHKTDFDFFKG